MYLWILVAAFAAILCQNAIGRVARVRPKDSCDKQRKLLTGSWGYISDGSKDYPEDSYCEWLILATGNQSGQFITLKFVEMETECSYDHIYIYDGDSYTSPLLGSFSGSTLPSPITANSGAMLILLYSDTNYVRQGFQAKYSVTNCPLNCSSHGVCLGSQCKCDRLWSGPSCSISLCPENCGETQNRGACHQLLTPPRCICHPGYSGQSCSLPDIPIITSANRWHLIAQDGTGFSARAGHAAVYISSSDRLYIYGGYAFGDVLGDLLAFDFNSSQWINLTTTTPGSGGGPQNRWGHAMTQYANNIVLFGGELSDGTLSNELWLYNIAKRNWQLEAVKSLIKPPAVTKHTLTLVEDKYLYVFGGSLEDESFSSLMYEINLNEESAQWRKVTSRCGKDVFRRLVGHTTVYHPGTKSLLVYGGLVVDVARFSKLSPALHAFHIEKRYWTRIHYSMQQRLGKNGVVPFERAFHSSVLVGNYLVVYGGYTHRHSQEEICYDDSFYFYHLGCHRWIDGRKMMEEFHGAENPFSQGILSHTMNVRGGQTLLVAGGYNGAMRGSLLAYVLPFSEGDETRHLEPLSGCAWHQSRESCVANLNCGWCSTSDRGSCKDRTDQKLCHPGGTFSVQYCSGLCATLRDCQSCLVWGEANGNNAILGSESTSQTLCSWCVQDVLCHRTTDPSPACSRKENASFSNNDRTAWWGKIGTDIMSLKNCQTQDNRPGMTTLRYRYPPNWEQPDEVGFINETSEDFQFPHEFSRDRDPVTIGNNVARFKGYIYPSGANSNNEKPQVQLSIGSGSKGLLKLSTDETEDHLEIVANHTSSSFTRTEAHRSSWPKSGQNRLLFQNTSIGLKYLTDFTVENPVTDNATTTMQIIWNAVAFRLEPISSEFLEPYRNGSDCRSLLTCLACLSDAACGWCQIKQTCMSRVSDDETLESQCHINREHHYLIIVPEQCATCGNYIDCESCVGLTTCEWLVEEATCIRKGRFKDAVTELEHCPSPCHIRQNCSSCLGDPGRCAWCEESQTCFLFATYTMTFMFGRCREWMDEDRAVPRGIAGKGAQCKNCSRHHNCKSCLTDLGCGWCGISQNPSLGQCVSGDFGGPSAGDCSYVLKANSSSIVSSLSAEWAYTACPDVEECRLGLHNCHQNATCINTVEAFYCTCKQGFKGDGVQKCIQTCTEDCEHGFCSESPNYKCTCDLGWTGKDCGSNCGCNNHSSCNQAVGICDQCQNYTQGQFCEQCRPGSYGNATTDQGCQNCICNNHADKNLGFCDSVTGNCFCTDNTEGSNCEKCQKGYYGDPKNSGYCYLECQARQIIVNATEGRLGSHVTPYRSAECLWILTVHPEFDEETVKRQLLSKGPSIVLTITFDMRVRCPHNHIYVYDGLPEFVAPGRLKRLLGTYCGTQLTPQKIVSVASSGFMTIYYETTDPGQGFNASYERVPFCNSCTTPDCRKVCYKGNSSCPNCSMGKCDEEFGMCHCGAGFGGPSCSVPLQSSQVQWTTHYDPDLVIRSKARQPVKRMGHTLVADANRLWLFGGYSTFKGDLNDVYVFDLNEQRWEEVDPASKAEDIPVGRHFHGSALTNGMLYVYGGLNKNGVVNDFWKFSLSYRTWLQIRVPLPALLESSELAGLTLTAVDENIVLIGGFSPHYGFLEKVLEYDTKQRQWQGLNCSGSFPVGLYGHTSVYHSNTQSIYVYGGIVYSVDRPIISGVLYAFHFPSRRWSRLPPDFQSSPIMGRPIPRYFHSAVAFDDYIVVTGGRSNVTSELIGDTFIYSINCNSWMALQGKDISSVGNSPSPSAGSAAVYTNGRIYQFGGFNGQSMGQLISLRLPKDICRLFGSSRMGCVQQLGCSHCSISENGDNKTFCHSKDGAVPSSCFNPNGKSETTPGTSCNREWLEKRDCYQYTSCSECVASWPAHPNAKQVCQWCSNCQVGRCIRDGSSCEKENDCNVPQRVVRHPTLCPLRVCLASDCEKCNSLNICMWTRQVMRSSEWGHTLNIKPIFDWTCVWKTIQDVSSFPVESMPPVTCPARCSDHTNCTTCRLSSGGEGGYHECRWSQAIEECMSPSYELLRCEGGNCGSVLLGSRAQCPIPCYQYTQAAHCLAHADCGWCAFLGAKVDGRGLCMEGGILGPVGGLCEIGRVVLLGKPLPTNVTEWLKLSEGSPLWTYLEKPPENECLNGHHTCDERHEECVDTYDGFQCQCKQGYRIEEQVCKPVCLQGCLFGTCVEPDVCRCHFGYVGRNCSTQCDCNGHSDCAGPDRLGLCLECHNNTKGNQCQKCKPLFVGNPINGAKCVPCKTYCNGHTETCYDPRLFNVTNSGRAGNQYHADTLMPSDGDPLPKDGPTGDANCLNCRNNTEGERCDQCMRGFFKSGEHIKEGCKLCECHGHGDMCNPLNGESCNCHNNTENDRQCSQKNNKNGAVPCWQMQCSKCKEYFLGVPTHGHQCYRHMFLDKDYCFDPNTQEECNRKPNGLLRGRTVFFAVQPRYMNVDIRITVDVTLGGTDFYLSAKEDTFYLDVNKSTGVHSIFVDRKYAVDIVRGNEIPEWVRKERNLGKREAIMEELLQELPNATESYAGTPLLLREIKATGLTTYITVKNPQEFLLVRNLANRLVITIPQEVHDLRSTRFYMVLRGVGSLSSSDTTFGSLFFRQDQTRIDLFVFFSVFFSCFFLFLAICVVVWKVKQALDIRQARRLHAAEMKHMASRPFGQISAVIEEEPDEFEFLLYSPMNYRRKIKGNKGHNNHHHHAHHHHHLHHHPGRDNSPKGQRDEKMLVRPVAMEPTSDGNSAVCTVLIQMPGGMTAPVRLALGSSLVTVRSGYHFGNSGIRAVMRRRASYVVL